MSDDVFKKSREEIDLDLGLVTTLKMGVPHDKCLRSEMLIMVDVDDTLVMHPDGTPRDYDREIEFIDPYTNEPLRLVPHLGHFGLIVKYKAQGYTVIVWSAGGYLWAEEVVKKLNLTDYVDLIMSKPLKYVDDLPAAEILGSRVYIPFKK